MRGLKISMFLLAFGAWQSFPVFAQDEEEEEEEIELDWKTEHIDAKKAANLSEKPLFIELVRGGDINTEKMEATFMNKEVYKKIIGKCVLCRLDISLASTQLLLEKLRIKGSGMPFMILIGKDKKPQEYRGGYMSPSQFLETFGPAFEQANKTRMKSFPELITEKEEKGEKAEQAKYYGAALKFYKEAYPIAERLRFRPKVRELNKKMERVDKAGMKQVNKARKAIDDQHYALAVAISKRLKIDFEGRKVKEEAVKILEELSENAAAKPFLETKPVDDDYDTGKVPPPPGGKEEEKTAKKDEPKKGTTTTKTDNGKKPTKSKGKKLIQLKLKNGTTLIGTIVASAGDKIFFKDQKGKSRFIKNADIESKTPYEE